MAVCISCKRGSNSISYSRHKKGSSGAGGNWALRAPIHKKLQKVNLHTFKGEKYCTKCLRIIKTLFKKEETQNTQVISTPR